MVNWRHSLRAAIALAHLLPDDRDLAIALASQPPGASAVGPGSGGPPEPPTTSVEGERLHALVELACGGDAEAFGQLYDHYVAGIYRFIYYRTSSKQLAEDLTGDTFVRALRAMRSYTWQGKDFGAWLTTIARNLVADHYKSSRVRLELVTDSVPEGHATAAGPERDVLATLTSEHLLRAVNALPPEQRDCILMRFMQGLSIAETAAALQRTEGAVKQLQLRAVRNLAKTVERDQ